MQFKLVTSIASLLAVASAQQGGAQTRSVALGNFTSDATNLGVGTGAGTAIANSTAASVAGTSTSKALANPGPMNTGGVYVRAAGVAIGALGMGAALL